VQIRGIAAAGRDARVEEKIVASERTKGGVLVGEWVATAIADPEKVAGEAVVDDGPTHGIVAMRVGVVVPGMPRTRSPKQQSGERSHRASHRALAFAFKLTLLRNTPAHAAAKLVRFTLQRP
jgi:hypothetical protein